VGLRNDGADAPIALCVIGKAKRRRAVCGRVMIGGSREFVPRRYFCGWRPGDRVTYARRDGDQTHTWTGIEPREDDRFPGHFILDLPLISA
jgi:hypothetical protein